MTLKLKAGQTEYTDWANDAISSACSSSSWNELLSKVKSKVKQRVNDEGYTSFLDLSELEQAAIIDRQFHELQQSDDGTVIKFRTLLNNTIDEELIKHSHKEAIAIGIHPSNTDNLISLSSDAIVLLLQSSPPELKNTLKLFLNRPLPLRIRTFVWSDCLSFEQLPTVKIKTLRSRLPPSTDVLFSRHCHLLLDAYFQNVSSRHLASVVKTVVLNFLRVHALPLPNCDETDNSAKHISSFEDDRSTNSTTPISSSSSSQAATLPVTSDTMVMADRLVFILVPLIVSSVQVKAAPVLAVTTNFEGLNQLSNNPFGEKANAETLPDEDEKSMQMQICSLQAIMGSRHLDIFHPADASIAYKVENESEMSAAAQSLPKGSFCSTSQLLRRTMIVLQSKCPRLLLHLASLNTQRDRQTTTQTLQHEDERTSLPTNYSTFEEFLDSCLKRGLSGLLTLDTTLFVWDQCFLTSFAVMLPMVLVSLLADAEEELCQLRIVSSAADAFQSRCRCFQIIQLQR